MSELCKALPASRLRNKTATGRRKAHFRNLVADARLLVHSRVYEAAQDSSMF